MTPTLSLPASMGMDETGGIVTSPRAARWERPELVENEAMTPLLVRVERAPHLPAVVGKAPPADPCRDRNPNGETWTSTQTWTSAQMLGHPAAQDPRMVDCPDPQVGDHAEDRQAEDRPEDPCTEGQHTGDHLEDRQEGTPPTNG